MNALLQLANQHHQLGRSAEAMSICRQVLFEHPGDPDALNLLGVLEAQAGRLDEAIEILRRSVTARPDFPLTWANLGCVFVNTGRLDEALDAYNVAIRLMPRNALFHHAVGMIQRSLGKSEAAIASFTRATELDPEFPDAHFKLGLAFRSQGRIEESIAAYSRVIALRNDFPDAHNNLGNALRDKGRLDEAIAEYKKAIQLNATDPVVHLNLANALLDGESFAAAVVEYTEVIRLKPDCCEAYSHLGFALAHLQEFDPAISAHRNALRLRPDDVLAHTALGTTLLLMHDPSSAEASFRRALSHGPESAAAWNGLGMALQTQGRIDDAVDCFRQAIRIEPDKAYFHKSLIDATRQPAEAAVIQRLGELLDCEDSLVSNRVDAGFALGKLLDDAQRYDEAFSAYSRANSLFRRSQSTNADGWQENNLPCLVRKMMQHFTPEFFTIRQNWGSTSELPVFIVGMPRSGTTLIEQIAASHAAVCGAGELQYIERAYRILGRQSQASGQSWDAASIDTVAQEYLAQLCELGGNAQRVIDKMPGNVFHLGLIAVMFPRSRVIFCRRDGKDTCLSCFFQQFGRKESQLFKYDLAECGRQFRETQRMIDHWLSVLPLRMLEMHYEQMVANQEGQSRRLIEFLGLPWDAACLEFHHTERTVQTASVTQVRQPIYSRSVGRWRYYERHLGPLVEALERDHSNPTLEFTAAR